MGKGIEFGKAFLMLSIDDNAFSRGIARARRDLRLMGRGLVSIGSKLTIGVGAFTTPIILAGRAFAKFDDQIRAVNAVVGGSVSDFKRLTENARELGRTTSFTADEVAQLELILGKRGFSTDQIETASASILDLARATGTFLPEAAEFAANTLQQFNLEVDQTARVADALVASANNSGNSLTDLANGLRKSGTTAVQFGIDMEQAAAALGVLANFGLRGEEGGVALRRVLLNLADAGKQAKLKDILGVELDDRKIKNIGVTLSEIGVSLTKASNLERATVLNTLFGARGFNAAGIIEQNTDKINELNEVLLNSEGVARRVAREMDAGLGGAFRIAFSAAKDLQLAIGKDLEIVGIKFLNVIRDISNTTTKWIQANQGIVVTAIKASVVIGALGISLTALGVAFQIVSFAMFGWAAALTLMIGLALRAVIPLGAIAVGAKLVGTEFSDAVKGIKGFGQAILAEIEFATGAISTFKDSFADIAETADLAFRGIKVAIQNNDFALVGEILGTGLSLGFAQGTAGIRNIWGEFKTSLLVGIAEIQSFFARSWVTIRDNAKLVWRGIVDFLKSTFYAVTDLLGIGFIKMLRTIIEAAGKAIPKIISDPVLARLDKAEKDVTKAAIERESASRNKRTAKALELQARQQRELARIERDRVATIKQLEKANRDQRNARAKEFQDKLDGLNKELVEQTEKAFDERARKIISSSLVGSAAAERKNPPDRVPGPGLDSLDDDLAKGVDRAKELSKGLLGGAFASNVLAIKTDPKSFAEKQLNEAKKQGAALDRLARSNYIWRTQQLENQLKQIEEQENMVLETGRVVKAVSSLQPLGFQ